MTQKPKRFKRTEDFDGGLVFGCFLSSILLILLGVGIGVSSSEFGSFSFFIFGMFVSLCLYVWNASFKEYLESIEIYYEEVK